MYIYPLFPVKGFTNDATKKMFSNWRRCKRIERILNRTWCLSFETAWHSRWFTSCAREEKDVKVQATHSDKSAAGVTIKMARAFNICPSSWTWSKIVWHFKIAKNFPFFMKNEIILEQEAEWIWNSSCNYILLFHKAWSFNFFKKSACFVVAKESMLLCLIGY